MQTLLTEHDKPQLLDQGMTCGGELVIDYARSPVGSISEQALNEAAALKPPDS